MEIVVGILVLSFVALFWDVLFSLFVFCIMLAMLAGAVFGVAKPIGAAIIRLFQ